MTIAADGLCRDRGERRRWATSLAVVLLPPAAAAGAPLRSSDRPGRGTRNRRTGTVAARVKPS